MRPKAPTIKSSLLRIHRAILKIDEERYAISHIPRLTTLEKMILLLEDRRFFDHRGVDWRSALREISKALQRKPHGGASTIDMQLFRTASDRYERTVRRKLREYIGVYTLQRKFNKIEILRIYLNVAYFGTDLTGALAAAKSLFPEHVDEFVWAINDIDLTPDQAAQIAALLVYPKPRIPNTNWQSKVRRRADYGLTLYARREQRLDQVLR